MSSGETFDEDEEAQRKLDFINTFYYVDKYGTIIMVITILIMVLLFCCLVAMLLLICKRRGCCCFSTTIAVIDIRDRRNVNPSRLNQFERLEQKLDMIYRRLDKRQFERDKQQEKAQCCAICIDDFKDKENVRETPCKHIFHEKCIMEWVKTKIEEPTCPQCRQEIAV